MYKIVLIDMPFAALSHPSLALAQLKAVVNKRFKDRVMVEICQLNHDFAHYVGDIETYQYPLSVDGLNSGFGEWFFRQSAFPEIPDNSEEYYRRYYSTHDEQTRRLKQFTQEKRQGLDNFLEQMIVKYQLNQADVAGFTSFFAQNVASLAMARKLKEHNPDMSTVMGGTGCWMGMGQEIVKRVKQIDFVFSGPALKSFPQFIGYCLEGNFEPCHKIHGVFSKTNSALWKPLEKPNTLQKYNPDDYIDLMGEELDINVKLVLDYEPFFKSIEKNFPNGEVSPTLLFETSRGCWWGERSHCTFCGLNTLTINSRVMNPARAIEQFEELFRYFPKCMRFDSVDSVVPKNYMKEVFPFLKTPPNTTIFYDVRANLSEEDLRILSKVGVKIVQPGIESLATSSLKLMKKGTTAIMNIIFLKNCLMYSIHPVWNLLVGFPGEGEDVLEKYIHDLPLLVHLSPPSGVFPVRFDRYSPYFDHAKQYGLDLHPFDFYELTYPFGKEASVNIAHYFLDHNGEADYLLNLIKWLGKLRKCVEVWRARWEDTSRLPPVLFFQNRENFSIIQDSRTGELKQYQIDDEKIKILEYFATQGTTTGLAKEFSHIPGFDPIKEVAFLKERGLVFQEGDRFLSLVLPKEPPLGRTTIKTLTQSVSSQNTCDNSVRNSEQRKPSLVRVSRKAHIRKVSS